MTNKQQLAGNYGMKAVQTAVFVFALFLLPTTANAQFSRRQHQIISTFSNKCVDVKEISTANGKPVQQWDCIEGNQNQSWSFEVSSVPPFYAIKAKHSGKCLDVTGFGTANGIKVQQWDCHGGPNQRWFPIPKGDGFWLQSPQSGKCLDVTGPSTASGTQLQIWSCVDVKQQIFKIEDLNLKLKTFQMVFASDPQYDYCESAKCKNGPKTSRTANEWHSAAISKLMAANKDMQGVVVNGDITNVMDSSQLDVFEELYAKKFVVYPGLGNHDIENYTPGYVNEKTNPQNRWGSPRPGAATSYYGASVNLLRYFAEKVRSNPNNQDFDWNDSDKWARAGSLAYFWDLGNYRFIQLNDYPFLNFKFSNYDSLKVGKEDFDIQSSLPWLRRVLSQAKNKKVILNMHSINSGDSFGQARWANERLEFGRILGENPNVVAIFAGHLHWLVGNYNCENSCVSQPQTFNRLNSANQNVGSIPVLFSGSAEYNLLLSVKFEPSKITSTAYQTANGTPVKIGNDSVITVP